MNGLDSNSICREAAARIKLDAVSSVVSESTDWFSRSDSSELEEECPPKLIMEVFPNSMLISSVASLCFFCDFDFVPEK